MQNRKGVILVYLSVIIWVVIFLPVDSSPKMEGETIREITHKLCWTLGEKDTEEEAFHIASGVAVDDQGNVYILDTGNSRVQCFSQDGKFLFSFGRAGEGPGEFSRWPSAINILPDQKVYIIDQRRILVYSKEGKHIKDFKTKYSYDDIMQLGGKYYLSVLEMDNGFRPIHVTEDFVSIATFGKILEPIEGIFEKSKKERRLRYFLTPNHLSSLVLDSRSHIFYSQRNPYWIIEYDSLGKIIKEYSRPLSFGSVLKLEIELISDGYTVSAKPTPVAITYGVFIKKDFLITAITIPGKQGIIFDFYNYNGKYLKSNYLPMKFYGDKQLYYITATLLDENNNFYILYYSKYNPPRLEKYRLLFSEPAEDLGPEEKS
jgi:hypothetical protein